LINGIFGINPLALVEDPFIKAERCQFSVLGRLLCDDIRCLLLLLQNLCLLKGHSGVK